MVEQTEVLATEQLEMEDSRFGTCPTCHRSDGFLNVNRAHWFICHKHKARWNVGSNLFSGWRNENEDIWQENEKLLLTYAEVDPWSPRYSIDLYGRRGDKCGMCGKLNGERDGFGVSREGVAICEKCAGSYAAPLIELIRDAAAMKVIREALGVRGTCYDLPV